MAENELQTIDGFKQESAISDVFAQSGMFPDIQSKAQALVKVLAGKELGISPFESMSAIYIVQGRLSLTANCKAKLIKKSPNYDYKVTKLDDTECIIEIHQTIGDKNEILGISTFTFKDAAKAGLVNKDNWKNYPRNMLFARALSNGCTWYCPEVVSGYATYEEMIDVNASPILTTIEMSDEGVKNGTT